MIDKRTAKSAKELTEMIVERLPRRNYVHLEVHPDPTYGWIPFVVAHPSDVGTIQAEAEQIATDLRKEYILKKEN